MKNDIRVLIVGSDSSVKGGITSVIDRFLNYNWDNIEIELLPTYIEGSVVKRIFFFLKSIFKYINRLIKNNFDIAHIHMSYKGSFFRKYLIVKLNKLFKKKTILHLHGSEFEVFYDKSNRIIKKMIKSILESVDSTVVLGEMWRSVVYKINPKSNIKVFNNAVNIPNFKVEWNSENINILFLGVLIKRKGIYDLVEAIRILNENGTLEEKNIKFMIGGVGRETENIKCKIREYGLNKYVEMVGWVTGEKKEELLKKAHLFVLPSYNEGLPMAILEAMSYGIPVISTDVGSISEVVKSKETGNLVSIGDIHGLAIAINESIKNEREWIEMSLNCKNIIYNQFNEKKYFKEFKELYEKIYYR